MQTGENIRAFFDMAQKRRMVATVVLELKSTTYEARWRTITRRPRDLVGSGIPQVIIYNKVCKWHNPLCLLGVLIYMYKYIIYIYQTDMSLTSRKQLRRKRRALPTRTPFFHGTSRACKAETELPAFSRSSSRSQSKGPPEGKRQGHEQRSSTRDDLL